jgi:hypothetical protein
VLSFSPDAAAISCSAGTAFCVAPFHRACAPGADMPALVCWIGPLDGVERSVIGCWVSHGTVSS